MVDAERLLSLLARVTSRLVVLDGYAAQDRVDLLTDRVRLGDLKYTFQTAIDACTAPLTTLWPTAGSGCRRPTRPPSWHWPTPG